MRESEGVRDRDSERETSDRYTHTPTCGMQRIQRRSRGMLHRTSCLEQAASAQSVDRITGASSSSSSARGPWCSVLGLKVGGRDLGVYVGLLDSAVCRLSVWKLYLPPSFNDSTPNNLKACTRQGPLDRDSRILPKQSLEGSGDLPLIR